MNVEQMAVAEYWRQQGLRSMTANRLAVDGIDSIEKLSALREQDIWRMPSVGSKGVKDICAIIAKHRPGDDRGRVAFLNGFSDADLVMEMLRRGYRVERRNGVTIS